MTVAFWSILGKALTITWFVAAMMILVEYINVQTEGRWRKALAGSRWSQYVVAAILGAIPGCLGAFVVVALYIHRSVTMGAVVACMIATSGDEAFVMLAMFPGRAVLLMLALAVVGILAGMVTDLVLGSSAQVRGCDSLEVHTAAVECRCFDPDSILEQLREPSPARGTLIVFTALFALALAAGAIGPPNWNWIRLTLLAVALFVLFVVTTVPEHFLELHLWRHVVLQHMPRIFLWTWAALFAIAALEYWTALDTLISTSHKMLLVTAATIGMVPESGPHLFFVTLYDRGVLPVSILVTNSIVQDGHGMLPLLSYSWRDFLKIKAINVLVGLVVGVILIALGR